MESLQSDLVTSLKALAEAMSKFNLGTEEKENSALSSDLNRSSNGVKYLGSKSSLDKGDSSMELSSEDFFDEDDVSNQISESNTSAGQDSEESIIIVKETPFSPIFPIRKKKKNKDTFIRDKESVKKCSPKKEKYIAPDKTGCRTSNRLTPPTPPTHTKASITNEGNGISL